MEDFFLGVYKDASTLQIVLETIASVLGISSVFFSLKRNIWVYPTGIISTFIYIFLLFQWGLYGETLINVYYTIMSVYGWILWSRKTQSDNLHVQVEWATPKEYFISSLLFLGSFAFILLIYYFRPYIDAIGSSAKEIKLSADYTWVDYIDALMTAIFLVGMWMMAKRKVDNWIFWIIGDAIAVFLFTYKGYGITAVQYVVFTILAIIAFFEWKKSVSNE